MRFLLDGQQSERLYFRNILKTDFELWLPFFQDEQNFKHWSAPSDVPGIACEKWYQKQFYRYENDWGGMNALIEKQTGNFIGHCGLLVQTVDETAELEVGYSLLPQFWNKGLATEAARQCIDFAFQNDLTKTLISIISVTNTPSEKVAMKNGMTLEKTTNYHENQVNIFRIDRAQWLEANQTHFQ